MKRIIALAALTAVLCGCSQVNEAIMNTAAGVNEASQKVQDGAQAAVSGEETQPAEQAEQPADQAQTAQAEQPQDGQKVVNVKDLEPDPNVQEEYRKMLGQLPNGPAADFDRARANANYDAPANTQFDINDPNDRAEIYKMTDEKYGTDYAEQYAQSQKEQQLIDHAKQTEKNLEDIAAASRVMEN